MQSAVSKFHLNNGLVVLLKEIHTSPIISHWIWYRVGSRNERLGLTGISHWVEHMQFKGTSLFPSNVLDKAIAREGGIWNAFTYIDWTTYFETMPADRIDLALRLESDRLINSLFDPEEVESERTVIISERQGNENEPLFKLSEAMQAEAFKVHPYHHEVIGGMTDLLSIQRDDLYQHYRGYYIPNNAVLAIAGDFETPIMQEKIIELYDHLPAGLQPDLDISPEPPQPSERQVVVHGPGETTYLQVAHRVPSASHPDFYPLMVLDSLLTGPSNLNMFGGGISNKTSHLYRVLVEAELAIGVQGGLHASIDPFLHTITIIVHPERESEEVIQALKDEIQRLQDNQLQFEELNRAVKQARALFAYGSESITNQAFWLGYSEMFATYDWFLNYLDKLAGVTPEDVQRMAQKYFIPNNRTVGVYIPNGSEG